MNNLGGTSGLEIGVATLAACRALATRGFTVRRCFAGHFMTAIAMAGLSVSVLRLPVQTSIEDMSNSFFLNLLDAPAKTSAWPAHPSGAAMDPLLTALSLSPPLQTTVIETAPTAVCGTESCVIMGPCAGLIGPLCASMQALLSATEV